MWGVSKGTDGESIRPLTNDGDDNGAWGSWGGGFKYTLTFPRVMHHLPPRHPVGCEWRLALVRGQATYGGRTE